MMHARTPAHSSFLLADGQLGRIVGHNRVLVLDQDQQDRDPTLALIAPGS
jgi:hypothetical protein